MFFGRAEGLFAGVWGGSPPGDFFCLFQGLVQGALQGTMMAIFYVSCRIRANCAYPDGRLVRYFLHLRRFYLHYSPACSLFIALAPLSHTTMAVLPAICRTCDPFTFHDKRFVRYLSQLRRFCIQ